MFDCTQQPETQSPLAPSRIVHATPWLHPFPTHRAHAPAFASGATARQASLSEAKEGDGVLERSPQVPTQQIVDRLLWQ